MEFFDQFDALDFEDFSLEGEGEGFDPYSDGLEFEEFGDLEEFGEGFEAFDGEGGTAVDAETASLMMDMYADIAAEAASDAEADAFLPLLGALAPMAVKALAPVAMGAAKKVLPVVAKSVVNAGRKLITSNAGRQALRALPNIARNVAHSQLRRVAKGQPVSPRTVMRAAAQQTLPYLRSPQRRKQAAQLCHRRAQALRRQLARPAAVRRLRAYA